MKNRHAILASLDSPQVSAFTRLVVDNRVHYTARGVLGQFAQVHGLVADSLSTKTRVPVDQNRHALGTLGVVVPGHLLGSDASHHHRIHSLQVGRVRHYGHVDLLAAVGDLVHAGT